MVFIDEKRSWMLLLKQCAIGSVSIAAITFVAFKLQFRLPQWVFIYLLAVIVINDLIWGMAGDLSSLIADPV